MLPFWTLLNNQKEPRHVTIRAFKIVFYFLLTVAVSFVVITYSIFGHL